MKPIKVSADGHVYEAIQIFYSELNGAEELTMLKQFLAGIESNIEKVIRGTENLLFVDDTDEGITKVYEQDYIIKDNDSIYVVGREDFKKSNLKTV